MTLLRSGEAPPFLKGGESVKRHHTLALDKFHLRNWAPAFAGEARFERALIEPYESVVLHAGSMKISPRMLFLIVAAIDRTRFIDSKTRLVALRL